MIRARFWKLLVLLTGLAASAVAGAHNVRFGFAFGIPLYPPSWYYPPPAYYYPPAVLAPEPPVYIERSDETPAAPRNYYWYYCPDSKTYYPYVKECRSPWQRVSPQPPGT
jgi:hypothetical protein